VDQCGRGDAERVQDVARASGKHATCRLNAIELLHPCDGTTCKTFDSTQEAIDRMQVCAHRSQTPSQTLPNEGVVGD
jgi:hypothetical protein